VGDLVVELQAGLVADLGLHQKLLYFENKPLELRSQSLRAMAKFSPQHFGTVRLDHPCIFGQTTQATITH
jgi:hypothetical protein